MLYIFESDNSLSLPLLEQWVTFLRFMSTIAKLSKSWERERERGKKKKLNVGHLILIINKIKSQFKKGAHKFFKRLEKKRRKRKRGEKIGIKRKINGLRFVCERKFVILESTWSIFPKHHKAPIFVWSIFFSFFPSSKSVESFVWGCFAEIETNWLSLLLAFSCQSCVEYKESKKKRRKKVR